MSENLVDGCEEYVAKVWWRSSVRELGGWL